MHISSVHLLGKLRVDGSELTLTDCTLTPATTSAEQDDSSIDRALSITGGRASLTRVILAGHLMGAIVVNAASLALVECAIKDCRAPFGGAVLISGGANLTAAGSNFTNNSADVSGGALQVAQNSRHLLGCTTPTMHHSCLLHHFCAGGTRHGDAPQSDAVGAKHSASGRRQLHLPIR